MMVGLAAPAVQADDLAKPSFSINGFGTVGVVHSSEPKADFTSSVFKPRGAGFTRAWSPDVDSRLGVQLNAELSPSLTGVLQLVAEQRHDNSYGPQVEWANLQYRFTAHASARIGRIALPSFLAADYRKVGYAYPWARLPGEVYGLNPVTNSDGVDAIFHHARERGSASTQVFFGQTDQTVAGDIPVKARDLFGVVHTVEHGPWTARAMVQQSRFSLDYGRPLFDAYRQFGAEGEALANRYHTDNKRYQVYALGASYDAGTWFVTGEVARTRTRSWIGEKTGWYVGAGYEFGQFTPYLMVSQIKANSATSDPGLALTPGLNANLNALLAAAPVQKTFAVGARWDVSKNAALKAQFERTAIGAGSYGPLANTQAGYQPGGEVRLLSVMLDFVF